ncbi:MAG: hypothetical protein OSB38_39325, partial [Paraburkholderia fungorum]|nr:hypothetical protein [Paraburkholderia fungorum]
GRQREVGAAPHRGNANRPPTNQGKAKDQKTNNRTDHKPTTATPKIHINNTPAEQAKKPDPLPGI